MAYHVNIKGLFVITDNISRVTEEVHNLCKVECVPKVA